MKVYSGPMSFYGAKVLIAAIEKALPIEVEFLGFDLRSPTPYGRHDEVDRINPKRQVPVLIDGPLELFDSTVIAEYFEDLVPSRPLWPAAIGDRARARLLEMKIDEIWFPKILRLRDLRWTPDAAESAECKAVVRAFYEGLEETLGDRDFLVASFSNADIAAYLAQLFAAMLGEPMPAEFKALNAWRKRIEARPSVAKVCGDMLDHLAAARFPAPQFAA